MRENSKKLLLILLACLLLAGCAGEEPAQTTVPVTTVPEETTLPPDTLYLPGSTLERSTGGAVRVYEADGNVTGVALLGENLLVCLDGARLQLLSGEHLEVRKERELGSGLDWNDSSLVLAQDALAYYDEATGTYVVLDENLIAAAGAEIGEKLLCKPVVSGDLATIYYATSEGIKAMEFTSGVTRLLREEYGTVLSLEGLLFEDSLLHYTRMLDDGTVEHCFVRTADGSSRHTGKFAGELHGWSGTVSGVMELTHPMGTERWLVYGGERVEMFASGDGWDELLFPGEGTVILQALDQVGLTLRQYDLTTGRLTAQVVLPGQREVFTQACAEGGLIWLCGGESRFCRWDTDASAASGDALEAVDTLDQWSGGVLEARAETLSDRYGVDIAFVREEEGTVGVDYSVYPDYRSAMYTAALDALEGILQQTPGEFWYQLARKTSSGRLKIRLVDDFDPAQTMAAGEGSFSVADGEITLRVSICADMDAIFWHELWHAMEVRITSTSGKLSAWTGLNPSGFSYEELYEPGEEAGGEYAAWFADAYGMNSAREDRAQVFMYAALEGQEARFESDAMQAKLRKLCDVIRSVYKLSGEAALPWEQYLNEA